MTKRVCGLTGGPIIITTEKQRIGPIKRLTDRDLSGNFVAFLRIFKQVMHDAAGTGSARYRATRIHQTLRQAD